MLLTLRYVFRDWKELCNSLYTNYSCESPCLVLFTDDNAIINQQETDFKIPTVGNYVNKYNSQNLKNDISLLKNAYITANIRSTGKLWEYCVKKMEPNFQYYCTIRWPHLIKEIRFWKYILKHFTPKALIVNTCKNPESHLLTTIGKQMGIPSFGLPHGGVQGSTSIIPNYFCYDNYNTKITYQNEGIDSDRLLPVRGLVAENEYLMDFVDFGDKNRDFRILIITTGYQFPGLIPNSKLRDYIEGFKAFKKIPDDLSDKIQINIKEHPNPPWRNTGLMNAAKIDGSNLVLPLNSNLQELLICSDIVVMLNNWSTPILHAIKAKKPIVIFRNVKLIKTPMEDQFDLPSGIVVQNADELWRCIRKYINDIEYRHKMNEITEKFFCRYLDDSNYPNLTETIQSKLKGVL